MTCHTEIHFRHIGLCRNSLGNGKSRSSSKARHVHLQGSAVDMDLDIMTARSNTATPGPSEDDIQSEFLVNNLRCNGCVSRQWLKTSICLTPGHPGFAKIAITESYLC